MTTHDDDKLLAERQEHMNMSGPLNLPTESSANDTTMVLTQGISNGCTQNAAADNKNNNMSEAIDAVVTEGDAEFRRLHAMALQGDILAQTKVGFAYKNGLNGVTANQESAVYWLQKAADQDHAAAQVELGICLFHGLGVEQDYKMAVQCFQKAADKGRLDAQVKLGRCFYHGRGVEQDTNMAVQCFQKAADKGQADAQVELGRCFYHGRGVEKDTNMAVHWWKKAADKGQADAQVELGICLWMGRGVEQDDKMAVHWWKKAADKGQADAQFWLGICSLEGTGCHQNLNKAHQWLLKAAEKDSTGAEQLAQKVAQLLSKPVILLPNAGNRECPVCLESFGPNQVPIISDTCNWHRLGPPTNKCDWGHLYCIRCVRRMLKSPNPQCYCRERFGDLGQFRIVKSETKRKRQRPSISNANEAPRRSARLSQKNSNNSANSQSTETKLQPRNP